jgi:hypothetical protein
MSLCPLCRKLLDGNRYVCYNGYKYHLKCFYASDLYLIYLKNCDIYA